MTYDVANPDLAWNRHTHVARTNWLMESHRPSLIIGSPPVYIRGTCDFSVRKSSTFFTIVVLFNEIQNYNS